MNDPSHSPKKVSLVSSLEHAITRFFYGPGAKEARKCSFQVGLQSPLWLWTHHSSDADSINSKELQKVYNLYEWFLHNHVDPAQIAIVVPRNAKSETKRRLHEVVKHYFPSEPLQSTVLEHHEFGNACYHNNTQRHFQAVVYVFGLSPELALLPRAIEQENFIGDAINAAQNAFVLLMDVGWKTSMFTTKWPQWKHFLEKLQEEQPRISVADDDDWGSAGECGQRLPALVGASIPLCCARHPNQRQLEYGLYPIAPACQRLCLHQYDCTKTGHFCGDLCHPARSHTHCPFSCRTAMVCGHDCLLNCSSICNCFQVIERSLGCTHSIVLGINKETLEPIYGTVHHVFKGVCADAKLPCAVEYTTECSRCLGSMQIQCFEAQQRNMVCGACRRVERELRAKILGEVLYGAQEEKIRVRIEMQRAVHQQRKAAAQGLFRPGAKVEITDPTKCVPPLFAEEDFPGIAFANIDDPQFLQRMTGAYGTFISNHLDVMDRDELRNLVRLPDGLHLLVTDGGLRMIRALTDFVKPSGALLLTSSSEPAPDADASTSGVDSAEFVTARAMVGELYYLAQPVPCAMCESGTLTDKLVRVVGVDATSPAHVMAQCSFIQLKSHAGGAGAAAPHSVAQSELDGPVSKRTKIDDMNGPSHDHEGSNPCPQNGVSNTFSLNYAYEEITWDVHVPISHLEPLTGYQRGNHLFVINAKRQVTDPHEVEMLEAAMQRTASLHMPQATLNGARVNEDTPYELMGIVNPPQNLSDSNLGPCALLRPRMSAVVDLPPRSQRQRRGARCTNQKPPLAAGGNANHLSSPQPLVAIPFMFTSPDEFAEAESALDAAAMKKFEQRLHESLLEYSDDMSLRHDEEAFHAQKQMPPVTPEVLATHRQAFSIPVPLPTPEQVAEAKRKHLKLPIASAVSARIMHAKDIVVSKQEKTQSVSWRQAMHARFKHDAEADKLYIRSLQAHEKLRFRAQGYVSQ